ncbi:zinc ribbon domain-containing protein [Conexibacter sp. W3-3-2]|uniref:FmdB family transcriptional regulator n=1 Tax=Paraconexibacter algicola TaxID=2133960 RepID=A0A2T4ULU0_9ACTN|nr:MULTISPECIES: zinc ribbon domain-containing protein [Solirubrobacterales]MTD46533.1 zinc ribbon domain-containing protein [Conexibacter sp. W3-3-2]PTL60175.1 FmdB family transcriptional regulator [Paraconexibacter algicola]
MPIYEYRRPDGSTFEVIQKFSDDALTKDPETGVPVERVLHAPAIHFKGKGFHNTDYGTRRRNRELEKSAEKGADDHTGKMQDKREAKAKESKPAAEKKSSSSSSKSEGKKKPKAA